MRTLLRWWKPSTSFLSLLLLVSCGGGGGGGEEGGGGNGNGSEPPAYDIEGKFLNLQDLLNDPKVRRAIANLPAGESVGAGDYYDGSTARNFSGTYVVDETRGVPGRLSSGSPFGGTLIFRITNPGQVNTSAEDQAQSCDGSGSFYVGDGNYLTVFAQRTCECKRADGRGRLVDVIRFILGTDRLRQTDYSTVTISSEGGGCYRSGFEDATVEPAEFVRVGGGGGGGM